MTREMLIPWFNRPISVRPEFLVRPRKGYATGPRLGCWNGRLKSASGAVRRGLSEPRAPASNDIVSSGRRRGDEFTEALDFQCPSGGFIDIDDSTA